MPRLGSGQAPVDRGPGRISPGLPGGDRGGVRLLDPLPVDPDMAWPTLHRRGLSFSVRMVVGPEGDRSRIAAAGTPVRSVSHRSKDHRRPALDELWIDSCEEGRSDQLARSQNQSCLLYRTQKVASCEMVFGVR
jgi:hypothetical protein